MKDRVSTKILGNGATRYGVYDEDGKLLRYEYIKLEDEPSTEGDFFNKANMLPDSIPKLLGLKMANPQVKDALNVLAHVGNLHVWKRVQSGVTDYLTSTDRNAYPDNVTDAQDAYYTLGEVETGKFALARGVNYTVRYANGNGIKVNDDGTFNLPSDLPLTGANSSTMLDNAKVVIGRTIQQTTSYGKAYTDFPQGKTYFIPSDAATGSEGSTSYDITNYVTKRQLVTGHASIPANTTITYLGQLGDKARVQFGSYVGTGTHGSSNPNSLNLSFTPRFLLVMNGDRPKSLNSYANFALFVYGVANGITVGPSSSNYEIPLFATWNKNSVSWYNSNSDYGATGQMNNSGITYRYVAIG